MTENIQREIEVRETQKIDHAPSPLFLIVAGNDEGRIEKNNIENIKMFLNQRKWFLKGNQLFADQQIVKERERIAINAKEIRVGSDNIWIWAAVDLKDETVIAVHASYIKDRATTYSFLKNVAKMCKGTLPQVFVNGGNWDTLAFETLGFKYIPVDFGSGNAAEGFLTIVDCRIRNYMGKFNNQNTPESMIWWVEGAAGFTNYWNAK